MAKQHLKKIEDTRLRASAPYNFVPLPTSWLPAGENGPVPRDSYDPERKSGWLDLTLTARTPIYVRGSLTPDEYVEEHEQKDGKKIPKPVSEFFQPGGRARIPGSTLRGMTRNLVEIVSRSRVDDVCDDVMHYRTFDGSRLGKFYVDDMVKRLAKGFSSDIEAGYLELHSGKYFIRPAPSYHGASFFRIAKNHSVFVGVGSEWVRKPVWFVPVAPDTHKGLCFGLVDQCQINTSGSTSPGTGWEQGFLIISGKADNRGSHWIIGPSGSIGTRFEVPKEVIDDYESGAVGANVPDTFPLLPTDGNRIPVFYKKWATKTDNRNAGEVRFGHTGMFRLPYKATPCARWLAVVPGNEPGIGDAIFGTAGGEDSSHSGSVYFEDAFLTGFNDLPSNEWQKEWQDTKRQPLVLGSPHPTAYPHYVCQTTVNPVMNQKGGLARNKSALEHWDRQDATPRGHKLYWHRPEATWSTPEPRTDSHPWPICVAKPSSVFTGRIRFDNLTKVQLGALLFVLQLPDGCVHKLGMGKPLGLGSVELECTLTLVDRVERYRMLFTDMGKMWVDAARLQDTTVVGDLKDTFARWALGIEYAKADELWNDARLKELSTIMHFENPPPKNMTDYLRGPDPESDYRGEFVERRVLPRPLDVISPPTGTQGQMITTQQNRPPSAGSGPSFKQPDQSGGSQQSSHAEQGRHQLSTQERSLPDNSKRNDGQKSAAHPSDNRSAPVPSPVNVPAASDVVEGKVISLTGVEGKVEVGNGTILDVEGLRGCQVGNTYTFLVLRRRDDKILSVCLRRSP